MTTKKTNKNSNKYEWVLLIPAILLTWPPCLFAVLIVFGVDFDVSIETYIASLGVFGLLCLPVTFVNSINKD